MSVECTKQTHKWIGSGPLNMTCEKCGRPYVYARARDIAQTREQKIILNTEYRYGPR